MHLLGEFVLSLFQTHTHTGQTSRVQCPPPAKLPNGYHKPAPDAAAGAETIEFFCNKPYILSGNHQSTCLSNGSWSSGPPKCVRGSSFSLKNTLRLGPHCYPHKTLFYCITMWGRQKKFATYNWTYYLFFWLPNLSGSFHIQTCIMCINNWVMNMCLSLIFAWIYTEYLTVTIIYITWNYGSSESDSCALTVTCLTSFHSMSAAQSVWTCATNCCEATSNIEVAAKTRYPLIIFEMKNVGCGWSSHL